MLSLFSASLALDWFLVDFSGGDHIHSLSRAVIDGLSASCLCDELYLFSHFPLELYALSLW